MLRCPKCGDNVLISRNNVICLNPFCDWMLHPENGWVHILKTPEGVTIYQSFLKAEVGDPVDRYKYRVVKVQTIGNVQVIEAK